MDLSRTIASTLLVAAAFLLCFGCTLPVGPSLDCANASGNVELAICSYKTLTKLDEKINARYLSEVSQLSAPAQSEVRDNQQQWLTYVRKVCDAASNAGVEAIASCIHANYDDRYKHLGVRVIGGRKFYFVQNAIVRPVTAADKGQTQYPGLIKFEIAYQQIDDPVTALEKSINERN